MKKIMIYVLHTLLVLLGVFSLAGMITLHFILNSKKILSPGMYFYYMDMFDNHYYTIIPYRLNIVMMSCVPFLDLYAIYQLCTGKTKTKIYWAVIFVLYTSFAFLRLTSLSA